MPGTGAQYSVGIGWHTNFILGIHIIIYLLTIAICCITGCYRHLVTMLCLFFYQTLETSHKVRGGGFCKICLRRDSFFVDPPLRRAETVAHPIIRIRNNPPLVIVVRSNHAIGVLLADLREKISRECSGQSVSLSSHLNQGLLPRNS